MLRAEGTINDVSDFRAFRPKEGDPSAVLAWRPLRPGIADLHRRAEIGRASERYLDALASVDQDTTLEEVLRRLGQPQYWHGRRVRALSPFAPCDRQLVQVVASSLSTACAIATCNDSASPPTGHPSRSPPPLSLGEP